MPGRLRDTLIHLDEVVVSQSRLQLYAVGHYAVSIDSFTTRLASVGNAAEMMRKFGFGHIRSYGVGGVTTPSFRGSGGSHTTVLWNGISLVSPLNGQSDLSLVPINFIDDVHLQSGGSATLYGSGAIGGTIQFANTPRFRQGFHIAATENIGSFKTQFHGLSLGWSKRRWISSTKLFFTEATNNFTFTNNNFSPARRDVRQHNGYRQLGLLQQNYFQITPSDLLSLRFWYQDNDTEVPAPSSVSIPSGSTQYDRFFRSMIGYNHDYRNGHVFIQSSHVHHLLDFRDATTNLNSVSIFDTFINTLENTTELTPDLEWTSGVNATYEAASGDELSGENPHRHRIALYTAVKLERGRWKNVLSARQEFIKGRATPFAPSLGIDYRLNRLVSIYSSVSRNYRIPTFNDLYWSGAGSKGNADLKSETSWSEEAGVKMKFTALATSFTGQFALFSSQVDDWILWSPASGIWSPGNIRKVWSRGMETNGTWSRKFSAIAGDLTVRYSFTASTSEAVYSPDRESEIGKQLFFTPRHESGVVLQLHWKKWHVSASTNYTGKQYTDDSNNEYLAMKAYQIANLWFSKDLTWKKLAGSAMLEINNLFNQQVNARPGYPLPGINLKAGITIRFNKPITNEN